MGGICIKEVKYHGMRRETYGRQFLHTHPERLLKEAPVVFPTYWSDHADITEFRRMVPLDLCSEEVSSLQELLDKTFDHNVEKHTYKRLKVKSARRVEDSLMWTTYEQSLHWVADCRSHEPHPLQKVWKEGDAPITMRSLSESWQQRMRPDAHETYLWHGTDHKSAEAIAKNDFRIKAAKSRNGHKLGTGAYLGASASLADHYTIPTDGVHAVLLVRAILGKVHITTKQASAWSNKNRNGISTTHLVNTGDWDSVCGDYRKVVGLYREYCVAYNHQLYPEYIIHYTRV